MVVSVVAVSLAVVESEIVASFAVVVKPGAVVSFAVVVESEIVASFVVVIEPGVVVSPVVETH